MKLISPHGGALVSREVCGRERELLVGAARGMPALRLGARATSDLELLATGAYSPLEGFLREADYSSVCERMRLASGAAWPLPVTLPVSEEQAARLDAGGDVALFCGEQLVGVLHSAEKYRRDRRREAASVYRTTDAAHPGVRALYEEGEWLLGGRVSLVSRPALALRRYLKDPAETRELFRERGWRRIVAFQTRNPSHRAHEYIQKCALEMADGLLLHPLVGETAAGEVPASVRMLSYETALKHYYPASRTLLAALPAWMRYAGPREALFHALVRKNYGCSHFIVGRDHAGVGGFYGPYDAQHIFDEFAPEELGVTPLFFEHAFYCRACGAMASAKTCPHDPDQRVTLSGTKVRELLAAGLLPPAEYTRPEVARLLVEAQRRAQTERGMMNDE
jgi:sulfate adenylyltransferase